MPNSTEIIDLAQDEYFMNIAIFEAQKAAQLGEVPVGAIAVIDNEVVAYAHNLIESNHSALAHAEVLLISQLNKIIGDWRLDQVTIYVTKEPCPMCAGAMVNSHLKRLVFGTLDARYGACGSSKTNIINNADMLWQVPTTAGVCEEECTRIFKNFFKEIRANKQKNRQEK